MLSSKEVMVQHAIRRQKSRKMKIVGSLQNTTEKAHKNRLAHMSKTPGVNIGMHGPITQDNGMPNTWFQGHTPGLPNVRIT